MKTLKVTGLTKNEVELRNHIYDYISYEDEMTTEDGGVFPSAILPLLVDESITIVEASKLKVLDFITIALAAGLN